MTDHCVCANGASLSSTCMTCGRQEQRRPWLLEFDPDEGVAVLWSPATNEGGDRTQLIVWLCSQEEAQRVYSQMIVSHIDVQYTEEL